MDNRPDLTKLGVKLPDSVMNNISEKTADLAGEALDASRNLCTGFCWNGRFYFKWNFIFYCICCWDDCVAFFFLEYLVLYRGFRLSAESTSISELLREPYTALWLSGLLFM